MANTLLSPSMIAKEALMRFKNNLSFAKGANRQLDDSFAVKGAKIGDTISVRKPVRYTVSDGATLSNQDVTEESLSFQLDSQKHVSFRFTSKDLTLTVDEFGKRYVEPAVSALANKVDLDGLQVAALNTYNSVGTPGTTPSALLTYLEAHQKLNEYAAPLDGRGQFINPAASTKIVDALKGLFQSSESIAEQYEKGLMGMAIGAKWKMVQNIYSHTVGPLGGTPLVNGASQTGAALITDGWTAAAAARLKKGDVFTIAGVNQVNPITKQSTGQPQQFVVTADVSSDASGNLTAAISPSIVTSGSLQTVSGSPADNAALTVVGAANTATPQNILMHEDAIILGCADLIVPGGVDMGARASDKDSGLSVRIIRQYDINEDRFPCRLDIVYGWKMARPEFSARIQG